MKNVVVLGCTGSIGRSAISILKNYPDDFRVILLANNTQEEALFSLKKDFSDARLYCLRTAEDKDFLNRSETYLSADIVINGIAGIAGLRPSFAVLRAGKILATANKESLVCAGNLLKKIMAETGGVIYPLDSEHSAVWQLLQGQDYNNIDRIIITASGGAFRDLSKEEIALARADKALLHPNWKMGKKVTVDCATLVNKGMEIIEAKHLFNVCKIEAIGHKESIIHALVGMKDNSYLAALSVPDMVLPIQYALFYPDRKRSTIRDINFEDMHSLHFFSLDRDRFPCFSLCERAGEMGDVGGTVLNAADEILVEKYLAGELSFYDISDGIESALNKFAYNGNFSEIEDLFRMDNEVREYILSERCS